MVGNTDRQDVLSSHFDKPTKARKSCKTHKQHRLVCITFVRSNQKFRAIYYNITLLVKQQKKLAKINFSSPELIYTGWFYWWVIITWLIDIKHPTLLALQIIIIINFFPWGQFQSPSAFLAVFFLFQSAPKCTWWVLTNSNLLGRFLSKCGLIDWLIDWLTSGFNWW